MKKEKFSLFRIMYALFFWIGVVAVILCYASPFVNPTTFEYLAPFGLVYPVIMIFAVILLFFGLLQRQWKRLIFLVLLLAIGFPLHRHYFGFGKSTISNSSEQTIKIMSYNVRLFDLYNWNSTKNYAIRDSIFNYLQQEKPDIICFQEFYYADSTKFKTKDTLIDLLKAKHFQGQFTETKHAVNQYFGVATLSTYPIVSRGEIELNSAVSNFCIFTDIEKDEKIIRIYNAHIGSIQFGKEDYAIFDEDDENSTTPTKKSNLITKLLTGYKSRADEIERILFHARRSPYPVIICGDINDTPISYCYQQINRHFTDSFLESGSGIGATYSGKIPPNRIDYIFHSDEFTSTQFNIQKDVYSDHRAITTNLTFHPKK
jgi:endonuclease/exonuclease/phosphatase family metal-dependent hydrolase